MINVLQNLIFTKPDKLLPCIKKTSAAQHLYTHYHLHSISKYQVEVNTNHTICTSEVMTAFLDLANS